MCILKRGNLTFDDAQFVFENYREDAVHINSKAGAFFTPFSLARELALHVPHIWENENSDGYCLTTGFCIVGGCDARHIDFTSQQAALLYGTILDGLGVKPTSDSACSTCCAEHMQNCI